MKSIKLFLGLVLSISSFISIAGTTLKKPESNLIDSSVTKKAAETGLSNVKIDSTQTFDILSNGRKLGTLVQGKGWVRDVHPICFISWSTEQHSSAFFMQTMGADDWETVDCDKVESVGILSRSDDKDVKIAVIYKVDVRGQYSQDYIVLGINNGGEVYYDESITEKFQNSYIKDIVAMRKKYEKIKN